jgi:hypothetical protein
MSDFKMELMTQPRAAASTALAAAVLSVAEPEEATPFIMRVAFE